MIGTRVFFGLCIIIVLALGVSAFLTLPAASQTTSAIQSISTELTASTDGFADGFALWRTHGCAGCHTLFGIGGQFAPDLTQITGQRGANYLLEFFIHPATFHPDQRTMPRFGLTVDESNALLSFLSAVGGLPPPSSSGIESDYPFPPLMIHVSGLGIGRLQTGTGRGAEQVLMMEVIPESNTSAIRRGSALFGGAPGNCASCHSLTPDVVIVGPSLAGIATRAGSRVTGQDAETYIRNSILYPSDFIVPGFQDLMAKNLGAQLSSQQIDDLIAFLMNLG